MKRLAMLLLLAGLAACGTTTAPTSRVVFTSADAIGIQSSPGGAVHVYRFGKRKRD